jgi:hypothetical protein
MRYKTQYTPQTLHAPLAVSEEMDDDALLSFTDETLIWEGSPSQWLNLGKYIWWGSVALLAIIVLIAFYGLGYLERYPDYQQMVTITSLLMLGLSIGMMYFHALLLHLQKTSISCNKITESRGFTEIFRKENYCELSDVIDVLLPPAGWLALVRRGDLVITTHDADQTEIRIRAIKGRKKLKEKLIPLIRRLRAERRGYRSV